jgi:hypothetical protein
LTLVVALSAGCGGSDSNANVAQDGVYEITSWTSSSESCDTEGTDQTSNHLETTHFFVKSFGGGRVEIVGCSDASDCQTKANDPFYGQDSFGSVRSSGYGPECVSESSSGTVTELRLEDENGGARLEKRS